MPKLLQDSQQGTSLLTHHPNDPALPGDIVPCSGQFSAWKNALWACWNNIFPRKPFLGWGEKSPDRKGTIDRMVRARRLEMSGEDAPHLLFFPNIPPACHPLLLQKNRLANKGKRKEKNWERERERERFWLVQFFSFLIGWKELESDRLERTDWL